jgi:hypothetical protein
MTDLLERIESLRIPVLATDADADWKDWYHFVLLDLDGGARILANIALIGGGARKEIQATLLARGPWGAAAQHITLGSALSHPWPEHAVAAKPLTVSAPGVELRYAEQHFDLTMHLKRPAVALQLRARPAAAPLFVAEASPFGSGYIGWGLVPGLEASGKLTVREQSHSIDGWYCYQDHNFGRFRWGEDIGWEWLAAHGCTSSGTALTVILHIRTNRQHDEQSLRYLFVCIDGTMRKLFLGPALRVHWAWSRDSELPLRMPGAMATLMSDKTMRTPVSVEMEAADERDRLTLRVDFDSFVELVTPDNDQPRYTRIGEASGPMRVDLQWNEQRLAAQGYAYGEFTH